MDLEGFIKLFNGQEEFGGNLQSYKNSMSWIQTGSVDEVKKKSMTCITFLVKSKKVLTTGRNSAGESVCKPVDPKLAKWLPSLTDEQWNEMSDEAKQGRAYLGAFSKINFTMAKRAALCSLEFGIGENKLHGQWTTKFGADPYDLEKDDSVFLRMNEKTREIFWSELSNFQKVRDSLK